MKYLIRFSFIIIFLSIHYLYAQTVKVDSVFANYGDTVLVPLEFYGYPNVGALTLFIEYDTTALEYLGITNLIPQGEGTLTNATIIQDTITVVGIAWSATTGGVNFPDGKYMDLRFVFSAGASDLIFYEPSCEIVDWDVNIITSTFIDGSVDHLTDIEVMSNEDSEIYAYSNRVVINSNQAEEFSMQVFDLTGRKLYSKTINGNSGIHEVILDHLHTGIYIVNLQMNGKFISEKLFLKNNN